MERRDFLKKVLWASGALGVGVDNTVFPKGRSEEGSDNGE